MLGLDAIYVDGRGVRVVTVVVASLHHLDIVLCNGRFLGKLLAQVVCYQVQVAVEEPAYQSQRKHIATLENSLVVHTRVSETVFYHLCQGALDDAVGIDVQLS